MAQYTIKQLEGLADFKQSSKGHELLKQWDDKLLPIAIFEANYIYFKIVTGYVNTEAEQLLLKIAKQNAVAWPLGYNYKAKWLAYFFYLMAREGIAPPLTWGKQNQQLETLSHYFYTPRLKHHYYDAQDAITFDESFANKILPLLKKVTFSKA